jgi:hypothetical protein
MADLDDRTQQLADSQSELRARRAQLQAQRAALTNAIAQRLAAEHAQSPRRAFSWARTSGMSWSRSTGQTKPTVPRQPGPTPHPMAETSTRTGQNTQLTLGGVFLGIAAIVLTGGLFLAKTPPGGRAVILAVATTIALGLPVLLARRALTATAETIAGFGLLLVLLDGYVAYTADLAGLSHVPVALFAAVLFALVAAVAAAYRLATHLRAPQFAALLAVQPLLPLLGLQAGFGVRGFAAVCAAVAAQNLSAVVVLGRELTLLRRVRPPGDGMPGGPGWPRMLRELAWILFGLWLATSVVLSVLGMAQAHTVVDAVRASAALLCAAAVGVVAGQTSGRARLRHVAAGAATLAIIASVSRVDGLALPQYTLVLTAALATAIAVAAGFLPEDQRTGPQLGSLVGATLVAVVVTVSAIGTAVASIRAATTPHVWAADIAALPARVHTTNWQVPVAAVLLTILAAAAVPPARRADAVVLGAFLVVLTAPGTGSIAWWAGPLLAVAAAIAATAASLYSSEGRSALIRSGSATLLGLYAIATSLATPELTAAVSALLAFAAASAVVLVTGWPTRFGRLAVPVADSAGGAAAFTAPIAVGTFAWLLGTGPTVVLALTMLATAAGVFAGALSQVIAAQPRTGSAGGALAAAIGCVVLSLTLDGATAADIGLAALLVAAAAATASSRAFEVTPGGLFEATTTVPAAVSALIDAVEGDIERTAPEPAITRRARRGFRVNGITLGAALATAALITTMARVLAVAVPGIGLVTTTAMVALTAVGVRALAEPWRRGPRLGGLTVGGAIAVVLAGVAVTEAVRAVAAGTPVWAANLATWPERVASWAPYGWQVPASLVLAAAAAWALLPAPAGGDVAFVTLALAGLATPAALGLNWTSPMVIAGIFALLAGLGAALVRPSDQDAEGTARRRLGLAAVLTVYAVLASAPTPGATASVLGAIVGAGALIAAVAAFRGPQPITASPEDVESSVPATDGPPAFVPGAATAAALLAGPGAAATIAVSSGVSRPVVLGSALAVAAFGALVVAGLRAAQAETAQARWGSAPAFGVGLAAVAIAIAALGEGAWSQIWAAGSALVAVAAAATLRPDQRRATGVIVATTVPAAAIAAIASAPAWLTALIGPYRTLRQIWQGYAIAPIPQHAAPAVVTLALLAVVAAMVALTLGGRRYLLAAVLPALAALVLVTPTALGAPRAATAWAALGVALVTGLGSALAPPTRPSAAKLPPQRLLRGTAGMVCSLTGAAGLAGSLATRSGTLAALAVIVAAAVLAATLGRDPAIRMVAWFVASAAAFALPVTAYAAAGQPVRPAAFAVLAICAGLIAIAFGLARRSARRGEAAIVELCALLGATFALLLTLGSARHAAAVLTICGLLLGAAALRRDRPEARRQWLVRAALAAEVGACWLLLYSVEVGLPEAYTLPFAATALLAGALELRRRPADAPPLSSWVAYGPALAGGFLPSLALVLIGQDPPWRWVGLLTAAVVTVIVGSWRRRNAPVTTGSVVALAVAVIEMIQLLRHQNYGGAALVAVAGVVLIIFGALAEQRRRRTVRRLP